MRVAIVDDTPGDALRLEENLERFSRRTGVELTPVCFADGQQFIQAGQEQFDLVIMDIDMPGMDGMQAARLLRQSDPEVPLMFVTNMPQYALAGYEVDAIDYVLKPVEFGDFDLKLQKALRYMRRDKERPLALHTTAGVVAVRPREILYVESTLHYLNYHTLIGEYRVRGVMGQAERELANCHFARCARSFLVNLRYVSAIEGEDVVLGSRRIRITRTKRAEFMERFSRFLGGMEP